MSNDELLGYYLKTSHPWTGDPQGQVTQAQVAQERTDVVPPRMGLKNNE